MTVSFLRAGFDEVQSTLLEWRRGLDQQVSTSTVDLGQSVTALAPFQAAWTRELLFDCGTWTAYVNNGIRGGDPTASAPYLSSALDVDLFIAMHSPLHPPGHASTQLWVLGPSGTPPLGYRRTISAFAQDGRWSWRTSGDLLPFEDPSRYLARRIRDRFDRALLVEYLNAAGIDVDTNDFYGPGVLVSRQTDHTARELTAADLRLALGL